MSVQQIEPKILVYVAKGLYRIAFNSEVNEWYSQTCRERFPNPETVWDFARTLADANAFNFSKRYPGDPAQSLRDWVKHDIETIVTDWFQFIKYCQYIYYNCCDYLEVMPEAMRDEVKTLLHITEELIQAKISSMPEYQAAKWSSI